MPAGMAEWVERPSPSWVDHGIWFICLLFYILATFKVISGWVLICDSAHSWWLYSASPLGKQAISTMTWFPTQSHYLDAEPTSPCPILIMQITRLGSNKYQFVNHSFVSTALRTCAFESHDLPRRELDGSTPNSAILIYSSGRGGCGVPHNNK